MTVPEPGRRHVSVPRACAIATVTLAVLGAVSACGNDDQHASAGHPRRSGTVVRSPTPAPAPTSSEPLPESSDTALPTQTSSTGSSLGTTGNPECGTPDLRVAVAPTPGGGTAGSTHETLTFTVVADHACSVEGFAGVSFVKGGQQVGAAARRVDADSGGLVVLAPGRSASEQLTVEDAGAEGDACRATPVDGIRVYPPDNRQSVMLTTSATGCASASTPILTLGPLTAAY